MFELEYQINTRYEELIKEAENYRLISQVKGRSLRRKQPYSQILFWLGRSLHKWGHLLLDRFSDADTDTLPQVINSHS